MSWSLQQAPVNVDSSGDASSVAATLGSAVAAGNLLVVNLAGGITGSPTIADTLGNTWVLAGPGVEGSGLSWYSVITNAGTPTINVTFGATLIANLSVVAFSCAGTPTLATPVAGTGSSATASAGPVTWSGNGATILAALNSNVSGTATPGSGYTSAYSTDFSAGTHYGTNVIYKLNDASGSATPSVGFASSVTWNATAMTFVEGAPNPTTATLTIASSSGPSGTPVQLTVTLDHAAATGGVAVPVAQTGGTGTLSATSGGSTITSITIAQGATSGTFWWNSTAPGTASISIGPTTPTLTLSGSPHAFVATNSAASTATLSGPTAGVVGVASSDFSVSLDGTYTGTITPHTGGAGTFTPTSLSGAGTFTYTPSTTAGSPHSISITASPTLTIAGSPIAYAVSDPAITRSYRTSGGIFAPGLVGTVGYTVYAGDGTVYSSPARVTSGISELTTHAGQGTGAYIGDTPITFAGNYHIVWDDGGAEGSALTSVDNVIPTIVDPTGLNLEQVLCVLNSIMAGLSDGFGSAGSTAGSFTGPGDVLRVADAVTDQFGNRSSASVNYPI